MSIHNSLYTIETGCSQSATATDLTASSELKTTEQAETAASSDASKDVLSETDENHISETNQQEGEDEEMQQELLKDSQNLSAETVNSDEYGAEVEMDNVTEVLCPLVVSAPRSDVTYGTVTHFTYESKTIGCERGANILLPADYDESKEYPVLYFLHGIFGDEYSMLGDGSSNIKEIVGNLTADGRIDEIIVVFPNMYASSDPALQPGFTVEQTAPYDNFINDLENDLIPYVEANYSVMKDREHRGLIGFSMGGREALFIGVTRSDLFSCIGAIAPAPGVTPGKDWAMEHPGQLSEDALVIHQTEFMPKLLMVCCGTKDSVVGKFPLSYHDIMTTNEVEHLWYEVPDADHDFNAIKSGLYNYLLRWFE